MIVTFNYDINQDVWSYFFRYINPALNSNHQLNKVNQGKPTIPEIVRPLIESLPNFIHEERAVAAKRIHNYLSEKIVNSQYLKGSKLELETEWAKYENDYFDRLKSYFEINDIRPMRGYLTSINGFPYNADAGTFFAPLDSDVDINKRIQVVMHEIMYIVFRDNFEKYIRNRGVGDRGVFLLTEAIAELLHSEFQDINPVKEMDDSKIKIGTEKLINRMNELCNDGASFGYILDELIQIVLES